MTVSDTIQRIRESAPDHVFCVFLNGQFSKAHSTIETLSPTHLVMAYRADGISFCVPEKAKVTSPIHLLFLQTEKTASPLLLNNQMLIEAHSECTFIEDYRALDVNDYARQTTLTMTIKPNAKVQYYKIQQEAPLATHHATIQIKQSRESDIQWFSLALGAKSMDEKINIALNEIGASCTLRGIYGLNDDHQQMSHQVFVDHISQQGRSDLLYKGILDKKSRAQFTGKVHVQKEAQKIEANTANHHLLLSPLAEASSRPELEINAEDVKCTHGSTTGQLDQDALFYLQSRGVDKSSAIRLLLRSFIEEVLLRIENKRIYHYVEQILQSSIGL